MGKLAGLKQAINKARRATNKDLQMGYAPPIINTDEVMGDLAPLLLSEFPEQDPEVLINADIPL